MNSLLQIKNIETYYGLVYALRGVSLNIEQGRITTILGSNGAGKTTLLNSIAGLIDKQPEKGEIWFNGNKMNGLKTPKIIGMGIGYAPEGRQIFNELTVKENLEMGAYVRRNRREVSDDIDKMFRYFPVLKDRSNQLAGTLSGGEQQMLAISRALMSRPKMLMLDEPSLGLSPILVKEIFEIIKMINEEGVTILLVEQNANMALNIAHYGYVLENGRFVTSGSTEKLRQDDDVKEFYLGLKSETSAKGYQRYKRKKRWN